VPNRNLLIVSLADKGYFPLLRDMVLSVRAHRRDVAIGILDLGFEPAQRDWLAARVEHLVTPDWDVDFPQRERTPNFLKAAVARPFLPRHFPGYEMYLYIDSDAWLQRWETVELYCSAAGRERIAITPEIDRAYKRHYKRPKLLGMTYAWRLYREAFGWRAADRLGRNPVVNCGAFALHREAPHWEAWQRVLARVLQRTRFFPAEQIAMNYLIFAERMPANFLPAYCNWMPGDAQPALDTAHGVFVEPYAPHEPIGIMHLAGDEAKNHVFQLATLDGSTVETKLRYSATRALCGRPDADATFAAQW
jgi:hypothetical protein